MKRIVLIRHGLTEANERRLYCGATDIPLSETGREALRVLRSRGGYPELGECRVYTSGFLRTEETLFELFGPAEHTPVFELREMDFGAFEMRGYEDLKKDPEFLAWCEGDNEQNVAPGGESGAQMEKRVLAAFESLLKQDQDLLLISHGGPIAAIMASLFPGEGKNRWQWQPRNGEGYCVLVGDKNTWDPIPKGEFKRG